MRGFANMKKSAQYSHCFVCSDTATGKIVWIDHNGDVVKEMADTGICFDIWAMPDGKFLYNHYGSVKGDGFTILNEDGSTYMQYQTQHEIFCCQPLENSNILVGEVGQKRLVEVDQKGKIVLEIPVPYDGVQHECMRMVRKINDFYLVVQPGLNKIRKLSKTGEIIKEYNIRSDAFGVVCKPNGNLIYTCMSGAYELDEDGKEIWSLEDNDVPGINIRWLLGIQLLKNGNMVFSNWMGHGHRDEGIHFFEVTYNKEVVWKYDGRGVLLEPATLQILDEDLTDVCFLPLK